MIKLDSLLASTQQHKIQSRLERARFRRLSSQDETAVPIDKLCQAIHIDRFEGPSFLLLGDEANGYHSHSVQSAPAEIERCLGFGVKKFFLHLMPFAKNEDHHETIEHHATTIRRIREQFGPDVEFVVDPIGIAFRRDLRWGIAAKNNPYEIDAWATLEALAQAAAAYGQAGIDYFLTIGRINCEAEVVRAALDKYAPQTKLMSFSTNSESPNAYIQHLSRDAHKRVTGQKLAIGNITEMLVRALLDIEEGVEVVAQKPIEGFHLLYALRQLLDKPRSLSEFLRSPETFRLVDGNQDLFSRLVRIEEMVRRGDTDSLTVAAYEISGTYAMSRVIEKEYSVEMSFRLTDEMYKNAVWAAGHRLEMLIGRNMRWYAHMAKTMPEWTVTPVVLTEGSAAEEMFPPRDVAVSQTAS